MAMSGNEATDRSSTWPSGSSPGVVVGDLLEQTDVEALVNPWNRNFVPRRLLLVGGVSGQLKKVTGPQPWKELAKHGLLPVGGVVITGGGRWPQRLIHVAGLTATWRATPDGVRLSAANVVRAAHAAGIASMAMPLIGAGHGRLSPTSALEAVLAGLDDVAELTRQLQIRIVLHPTDAGILP